MVISGLVALIFSINCVTLVRSAWSKKLLMPPPLKPPPEGLPPKTVCLHFKLLILLCYPKGLMQVYLPSNCIEPVRFTKLHEACANQTRCNLIFADLLQVVETTDLHQIVVDTNEGFDSQLASSLLITCDRFGRGFSCF